MSIGIVRSLLPLAALLVAGFAAVPAHASAPYFDGYTAFAAPLCSSANGGTVTTGARTFVWVTPLAGALEFRNYTVNGKTVLYTPPYAAPPGAGTAIDVPLTDTGIGPFPFTYTIQITTMVGGMTVSTSQASIRCTGNGPGVATFDLGEPIASDAYYGYSFFAAPSCSTSLGGSIETGARTVQWSTPPGGATLTAVTRINGVPYEPFVSAAPVGTGTTGFGPLGGRGLGAFPFTYSQEFTTSVGGEAVGFSQTLITCNAAGRAVVSYGLGAVPKTATAVEYYWAARDHYFITASPAEIAYLDAQPPGGWARTGLSFGAYAGPTSGASPVCRFYIPPPYGDSHLYSASPAECALAQSTFPMFTYEAPNVFYINLPGATSGHCPFNSIPVYRLWNDRVDTNHRYTTSPTVRDAMLAQGYVAEGYGPDAVSMCAPQ